MSNIFISRPTTISKDYERSHKAFERFLKTKRFTLRRLGAKDYSLKAPLKAVMALMEQCDAAVILGYPQHEVSYSLKKGGKVHNGKQLLLPTPWNQIEGTLAYKKGIPVLVIAQEGVEGGLFDFGVTGEYVYKTDLSNNKWFNKKDFLGIFSDWKNQI